MRLHQLVDLLKDLQMSCNSKFKLEQQLLMEIMLGCPQEAGIDKVKFQKLFFAKIQEDLLELLVQCQLLLTDLENMISQIQNLMIHEFSLQKNRKIKVIQGMSQILLLCLQLFQVLKMPQMHIMRLVINIKCNLNFMNKDARKTMIKKYYHFLQLVHLEMHQNIFLKIFKKLIQNYQSVE